MSPPFQNPLSARCRSSCCRAHRDPSDPLHGACGDQQRLKSTRVEDPKRRGPLFQQLLGLQGGGGVWKSQHPVTIHQLLVQLMAHGCRSACLLTTRSPVSRSRDTGLALCVAAALAAIPYTCSRAYAGMYVVCRSSVCERPCASVYVCACARPVNHLSNRIGMV